LMMPMAPGMMPPATIAPAPFPQYGIPPANYMWPPQPNVVPTIGVAPPAYYARGRGNRGRGRGTNKRGRNQQATSQTQALQQIIAAAFPNSVNAVPNHPDPNAPVISATTASAPASTPPRARPEPSVNTQGVLGGVPHEGPATAAEMAAFSLANPASDGTGRCFNFWRRGNCRNGPNCRFAHT
jgi:hypothetical protein